MPDGRDLTIRFVTDLSELAADEAARQLDDAGESVDALSRRLDDLDDTARRSDLDQLGDAAHAAGRQLDDLGDTVDDTARSVDDGFDRIKSSARSGLRGIDDDVSHAKEGLGGFKEEAHASGREAAASFSGSFDDVASTVQEVAANAFAGFGPLGAAAGLAAAAGIGFIVNRLHEAKEQAKELADQLISDGGRLSRDSILSKIQEAASSGDLDKLTDAARKLGVQVSDLDALFGSSTSAKSFLAQLDELTEAQGRTGQSLALQQADRTQYMSKAGRAALDQADALHTLRAAADQQADRMRDAEDANAAYAAVAGVSAQATSDYADAMGTVTEAGGVMADAIETAATRQADATGDASDSWTDYRDTALASIDDVIGKQLEQLTAAEDFRSNTKAVFERLGEDAVEWAVSQGDQADKAMQLLATAPISKGRQVVENYRRLGQESGEGLADTLRGTRPHTAAAADALHDAAEEVLRRKIDIPVGVAAPSYGQLAGIRRTMADAIGTIRVPVVAAYSNADLADMARSTTRYRP